MNEKLKIILDFVKEKKTSSVKVLDISKISILADYFVIIAMDNQRTVDALYSDIVDLMDKHEFNLKGKEGINSKWVLLDYGDIVIHIFDNEYKETYSLDKLWADAEVIDY